MLALKVLTLFAIRLSDSLYTVMPASELAGKNTALQF